MNIGIIGCGYLGKAAASYWRNLGHFVTVTTRRKERIGELKPYADEVYLLGGQGLLPFLKPLHALLISVAPDPSATYEDTYTKTAQDVTSLLSFCPQLKQILYTSSTSVYGEQRGNWVDETTPVSPTNKNQQVLCDTEQILLHKASPHLIVSILRLGEIHGPGREIIERLKRTSHHPFPGTGENYTNLSHVTEVIQALDFLLQNPHQGLFNICHELHPTRRQLYDQLSLEHHLPLIQWDPSLKSIHGGNKRVNSQKLKDLGYHTKKI